MTIHKEVEDIHRQVNGAAGELKLLGYCAGPVHQVASELSKIYCKL